MNDFITWSILATYSSFIFSVFIVVNFTKELKHINSMPTKYYSAVVAYVFLVAVNIHNGTFVFPDLFLYALQSIFISLSANGVADFNKKKITDNLANIIPTNITPTSIINAVSENIPEKTALDTTIDTTVK